MKDLDKYRGCIIGGAVGDALGGAIEFDSVEQIYAQYGENGITEYSADVGALITDDTQMTLYTANGILCAVTDQMLGRFDRSYADYIADCYKDWYDTQMSASFGDKPTVRAWLKSVKELGARRAPGNTCLNAIANGANGTLSEPINNSKGCGGVMRVAPIGLFFDGKTRREQLGINYLGAQAAALTHGHDLGFIPAAALVHIVSLAAHHPEISLKEAVADAINACRESYGAYPHIEGFTQIMNEAIRLSALDVSDLDAIELLGEGWVAEEALAIAVYCALKYENDFEKAIIASVNHGGDSDSTGSITGNILGARLGLSAIPKKFLEELELLSVITEVADDLFKADEVFKNGMDESWKRKYVENKGL